MELPVFQFHRTSHLDFEIDLLASSISPDVAPARVETFVPTCSVFLEGLGNCSFLTGKRCKTNGLCAGWWECRCINLAKHSETDPQIRDMKYLCRGTKSFLSCLFSLLLVFSFFSFLGTSFVLCLAMFQLVSATGERWSILHVPLFVKKSMLQKNLCTISRWYPHYMPVRTLDYSSTF